MLAKYISIVSYFKFKNSIKKDCLTENNVNLQIRNKMNNLTYPVKVCELFVVDCKHQRSEQEERQPANHKRHREGH